MKAQLNEVKRLQKIAGILKEEDNVYQRAGAMIPQVGFGTLKNIQKIKNKYPNWIKGFDEEDIANVTDEYIQWLDKILPELESIYNSNLYQMHLSSLKSGGSSREDYDYLKYFINTIKRRKSFIES